MIFIKNHTNEWISREQNLFDSNGTDFQNNIQQILLKIIKSNGPIDIEKTQKLVKKIYKYEINSIFDTN